MHCTPIKKGWLSRTFEVATYEGRFVVEYQGDGMGFERVLVGGIVAAHQKSFWWFVPRFDFWIGETPAVLEVRVWAWLQLKSLRLTIGNQTFDIV